MHIVVAVTTSRTEGSLRYFFQFMYLRCLPPTFQRLRGRHGFEKLSPLSLEEKGKTLEHLPRLAYGVYYCFDEAASGIFIPFDPADAN